VSRTTGHLQLFGIIFPLVSEVIILARILNMQLLILLRGYEYNEEEKKYRAVYILLDLKIFSVNTVSVRKWNEKVYETVSSVHSITDFL
jgi:hypothetical protein